MLANPNKPGYYGGNVQQPENVQNGRLVVHRLDFIYDFDLDRRGVFAYLKKQCPVGDNPSFPGPHQSIKMFASSVG